MPTAAGRERDQTGFHAVESPAYCTGVLLYTRMPSARQFPAAPTLRWWAVGCQTRVDLPKLTPVSVSVVWGHDRGH